MGFFKKKESTHFERDEEGKVIQTTRNGQEVDPQDLKMKTSRQLEQEYYSKHPEKKHPTIQRIGRGAAVIDKKIVNYNRTRNIMNPQRKSRPRPGVNFVPRQSRPSPSNANPFGNMFDMGMRKIKNKNTKLKKRLGFDPFDNSRWF